MPHRELLPEHEPLPRRDASPPAPSQPLPRRDAPQPAPSEPLPRRIDAFTAAEPLLPQHEPLPRRGDPQPAQSQPQPLPRRGDPSMPAGEALPRRTTRTRRAGRHRSPHRLTVPSDAPALILAVPGSAAADHDGIAAEIAELAALSCPGVDIRLGYLAGESCRLSEALTFEAAPDGPHAVAGVVVPLLAGPYPAVDAQLAQAVSEVRASVLLAAHLGPHPLVAEALHGRLADAGLARQARARGLSIATAAHGVLVVADGGLEAVQTAEVAAVLLASRLSLPTATALLGDTPAISRSLSRLREAGSLRTVAAPCVIGPETPRYGLDSLSAQFGIQCSPPLGAHPAVAQLVAIRYGAALARLSMASSPAETAR